MTELEFINEKIKETKRSIRTWKMLLKNKPNDEVLAKCLNIREKELQSFQQIKNDLEAWEVVKEELQIILKSKNYYGEPLHIYELNVIGQNKINTLEKALEVENND